MPDQSQSAWSIAGDELTSSLHALNAVGIVSIDPNGSVAKAFPSVVSKSGSWLSSLTLARVGLVILGFVFIAGGIGLAAGDELAGAIEKVGKVAAVAA